MTNACLVVMHVPLFNIVTPKSIFSVDTSSLPLLVDVFPKKVVKPRRLPTKGQPTFMEKIRN